jgi:hypothetical protein
MKSLTNLFILFFILIVLGFLYRRFEDKRMREENNENNDYHACPLCHEMFPVSNLFFHIMYTHPAFLAVWSSLMNPNRQTGKARDVTNGIIRNNFYILHFRFALQRGFWGLGL